MVNAADDEKEPADLETAAGKADASELATIAVSDAASDSPGDDALLVQEELYEGLSSDRLPSEKIGTET
jgi:hypothetical protein